MTDESVPSPEPGGALVPPRHPPTALAAATPEPPHASLPSSARRSRPPELARALRRAVDAAHDLAVILTGAIDSARGKPT
jgi:hypothetical protein